MGYSLLMKLIQFLLNLGFQVIGVVATIAWCAVITFVILKLVDMMVGLRVEEEEEIEGLDIVLHNERGYNI